jgi:ubiquinone/menaquinone biosynthesis C-methylase UbiE
MNVREGWRRSDIVDYYATTSELAPGEQALFERFRADIAGKAVLDIGIGTGRTTPYLMARAAEYTGVDYSPEMIEKAKELHPAANLLECDARDLSRFGAARFDCIVFSFNGIDSVSDADRQIVLKQVLATLRPGGLFLFSSHNLASVRTSAYSLRNLAFSANPIRLVRSCRYYLKGVLNHLRARGQEIHTPDYALLTERATHYRYLNYYISKALQVEQLERAGFVAIELFDENGQPTGVQRDDRDRWIHYAARKPA